MRYLNLLIAFLFIACSTENNNTVEDTVVENEVVTEPEIQTVVETVFIKESEIDNDNEVKVAFENMVEALNSATPESVENLFKYVDQEYVLKGKTREENIERVAIQLEKFETTITDLRVQGMGSSCDLAYVIASFKKTISERATGVKRVDGLDKVGLFIMRKGADGNWRLLVQKTDNGFAHWFYMPETI
jgi:ketosteroid isomerase-like protein